MRFHVAGEDRDAERGRVQGPTGGYGDAVRGGKEQEAGTVQGRGRSSPPAQGSVLQSPGHSQVAGGGLPSHSQH